MTTPITTFASKASAFLGEEVLFSLTDLQKRVMAVALIVFVAFVSFYFIIRSEPKFFADIDHDRAPTPVKKKAGFAPQTADDYLKLGQTIPLHGTIELPNGQVLTHEDIALKAIELNPQSSKAYNYLGSVIDAITKIKLPDGTEKNQQELFLKAVELDPQNSAALNNLGATLEGGGTIDLPDGSQLTREQQFVRVIKKHQKVAHPAATTIKLPNQATEFKRRDLFYRASQINERNGTAYYNLASTLKPKESLAMFGDEANATALMLAALQCNQKHAEACSDLANRLALNSPPVALPGLKPCTKKGFYLHSIELDRYDASVYYNLALIVQYDEKVTLPNGKKVTTKKLLLKAIDLNPYCHHYYAELLAQLAPNQTIRLLDGTLMTRTELEEKIDECANKYGIISSPY